MTDAVDRERLAVLVHEVRSPVAALSAIATAFAELPAGDGARKELVTLAISACVAVERLVIDASPASLRIEDVDLTRLAGDVAAAARLGGARVELDLDEGLPAVAGDPVRLGQALSNLVTNALVHAGPDGRIGIAVTNSADGICISVRDEGPGIARSELNRVFDPGVRLDASRPGSGIGLSVVKAVVEAHGGDIRVESSSGEGTTVAILLPTR